MNMLKSTRSYDELLNYMKDCGYSDIYISKVMNEIQWIESNQIKYKISTYEELYDLRRNHTISENTIHKLKTIYGIFQCFSSYGNLINKRCRLNSKSAFIQLNEYYKTLLNLYREESLKSGIKERTVYTSISACSGLLLALQSAGHETLEDVQEKDVLSYFLDGEGNIRLSSSTKCNIKGVFTVKLGIYSSAAKRILNYLPELHTKRKTIQYLTSDEIIQIKAVLNDTETSLSLRDRAIGKMLLHTGMRAGDIAGMTFSDIDWNLEEIKVIQQKTGNLLELPLMPIIGNAIYDYINEERPHNDDKHIFMSKNKPYKPICNQTINHISQKIYETASIRQKKEDQKGAHLFRHNFATSIINQGIPRPIISATLGHCDPDSLDSYLSADIRHLRECALDIKDFSVDEGVFLS